MSLTKITEFLIENSPPNLVNKKLFAFFSDSITDDRGDTFENAFRRSIQYRRSIGDTFINDVIANKSMNSTSIGVTLQYLCVATQYSKTNGNVIDLINKLAQTCINFQNVNPNKANYGGYCLATSDGTASCFGAASIGLGLLAAYRLTLNPKYLQSCILAATFLQTLNNPNPVYSALYSETVIPNVPENASWAGFCDTISAGDVIHINASTWNLLACKFLKELYEITGTSSYQTLYQSVRDWMSTGITGLYDFWAIYYSGSLPAHVSSNWFGTGLIVNDGAWHRRGESVISGSPVFTGSCTAATATTITLDASASGVDDYYNGMAIRMTSGAAIDKGSIITDYNGTTKEATIQYPFPVTPSASDTLSIGLAPNTIGSDQMEYGLQALYATNYNLTAIKTTYETLCNMPNADTGSFGTNYNSRICWTGYFRINSQVYGGQSKAYGTHYDVQGMGPLLKFKFQQYPNDWQVCFEKAILIPEMYTLVNENFENIWSTDSTGLFEYATVGIGTVKGIVGIGIVESYYA